MVKSRKLKPAPMRTLRIASDCTGLNAAALALESLRLRFEEVWASDTAQACRALLAANFKIRTIYSDAKDVPAEEEALDFYSAGSPCPSFSRLGKKEGLACSNGQVLMLVLRNVLRHKPRTFLLENVADLMSRHEDAFKTVIKFLKALRDPAGEPYYTKIYVAVLNSLHHGTPQSRHRVYIAGIHKPAREFRWPAAQQVPSLEQVLDPVEPGARPQYPENATELRNLLGATRWLREKGIDIIRNDVIADIGHGFKNDVNITRGHFPCLLKSRAGQNGYWIFSRQRKPRLAELCRVQGVPPSRLKQPERTSERQIREMLGNSFTVPVVAAIIDRLFFSAGLTSQPVAFKPGSGQTGMVF